MSKDDANRLTAEYLMRQVPEEDWPRFVSQPRHEDGPEHTTPLQTIAGFAVLALVGLLFWGVM